MDNDERGKLENPLFNMQVMASTHNAEIKWTDQIKFGTISEKNYDTVNIMIIKNG